MTFAQLIKILDLLDHDKSIIVKKARTDSESDDDELDWVDMFSKCADIQNYAKYFMSSDYRFFVNEGDDFTGDEIIEDGTLEDSYE